MTATSNTFENATFEHHAGQFVDFKPGWWVFSDMVDEGGRRMTMGKGGPFPSREAATICADMANAAKVEEIPGDMVKAARRAYLGQML